MIANDSLTPKLLFDPRRTVRLVRFLEHSVYLNSELFLALLSFADLAFEPFVVAGTANQKHITKCAYGVVLLFRLDKCVPYSKVFAKYAAAFFRISFSSLSLAISR